MLKNFLEARTEQVYALMRVLVGLMFAFHGLQKVFGVLTESPQPMGSQLWIGGLIEVVTGLLVAVGFLTVWAAFLASGTMAVAYVQFHWKGAFDSGFFPGINRGELAVVYALLFLFMACRGPGIWSVEGSRT